MVFGEFLVYRKVISIEVAVQALNKQRMMRKPFGEIAIRNGKLEIRHVFEILNQQADHEGKYEGMRFGDIAVALGFLSEQDVRDVLAIQHESCPPIEEILIELGVVDREMVMKEYELFVRSVTKKWNGALNASFPS
jgi:hypothetical protein